MAFAVAFRRFHPAPGKLGDAYYLQVRRFHQAQMLFPARLRPLLWIPRCADENRVLVRNLRWERSAVCRRRLRRGRESKRERKRKSECKARNHPDKERHGGSDRNFIERRIFA